MTKHLSLKTTQPQSYLQLSMSERLRKTIIAGLAGILVFVSTSSQSLAQTKDNSASHAEGAQITLNLQDVDIRVLINTVAEVSGKNFVVDPRVKGKVSVISGAPLDPDQLYDVFLSILEVHKFATVVSGSVIKVLPSVDIKQRPTPFGPSAQSNDEQITQIIQLQYAPVQDLVAIIRPLIPSTSHFAPHVASNSVVITDTAANIQRVMKIIKRIDVPDKRSSVHVVYLEKTKASDLAATLTQIVASSVGGEGNRTGSVGNKVSIQAMDAINALVINATDDQYAKIQALIDELDIERQLEADINVIYLRHAKAEDLVSVLNDVTKSENKGNVYSAVVQADEATNSIVIKATGAQLQTMRTVIDKLDIRRPQVFIETVIAEVSLNQAASLGVTWGAGGPNVDSSGEVVGNLIKRDRPNQIIGTASIESAFELATGGLQYSLLDFTKYNLNVVVQALRSDTNSNILSTPTILTLDNEEAEIIVGQEVPFVTGSFNNGNNNSTATDSNGNIVSTSGSSFQTIERKDVGIKLRIKPQISDGNTIKLEVFQEISSVETQAIAGQADLITNRRSIEATVQVDDGQVIVLGGLIQDDVVDTVNRVPILGSIPIIGALFRSKSKKSVKRNLMVFLKPHIIRSADDLESYSRVKYDEVRRDSKFAQNASSKYLIKNAQPAILDEYDNVVNDGILRSEHRSKLVEGTVNGEIKPTGLRKLFSKNKKQRYKTAVNDDSYKREEAQNKFNSDAEHDEPVFDNEPIRWGDSETIEDNVEKISDENPVIVLPPEDSVDESAKDYLNESADGSDDSVLDDSN